MTWFKIEGTFESHLCEKNLTASYLVQYRLIIVAHLRWATIIKLVMSVCLCVCVSVCLSVCVSVCLSVCEHARAYNF